MAFTEFYCNASTGSNMNGGSDENTSPSYSATNGGWNSGTGVFTPTAGDPSASVTVGQFAHVFADGATTPTFIGRVTAVDSTTVTVSTTAKSGTAPGTSATGISINVGGVWKGPNAAVGFPFGFITNAQVNAAGDYARVNFKNNASYAITAGMSHSNDGPLYFQGYSSTVGDGGRATFAGPGSGASFVLLTVGSSFRTFYTDLIFNATGFASGTSAILASTGNQIWRRCVAFGGRGSGFGSGNGIQCIECESYSNTSHGFAFQTNYLIRCIAHDNGGAGFSLSGASSLIGCIADTNTGIGFTFPTNAQIMATNCDAYNNGSHGFSCATLTATAYLENCNAVKNGGYGLSVGGGTGQTLFMINFGFGSGTQANTSGQTTTLAGFAASGSITYAADTTPWVDPANGDFRINLTAAKGTGRGTFTQTAASYAGTVGYPDVGAAQHQESTTGTVGPLTGPGPLVRN